MASRYDFLVEKYRCASIDELLEAEQTGGKHPPLPGPGDRSPTERPT